MMLSTHHPVKTSLPVPLRDGPLLRRKRRRCYHKRRPDTVIDAARSVKQGPPSNPEPDDSGFDRRPDCPVRIAHRPTVGNVIRRTGLWANLV